MRKYVAASVLTAASLVSPAFGQRLRPVEDEVVDSLATVARENITRARFPDGSPVPAETPHELSQPIVPVALSRQTARRGFLSGEMQACNMTWESSSFGPYMLTLRSTRRYSPKQLAYLGFLHGFSQELARSAVSRRPEPCTDADRLSLERSVRGMVILTP